MKVECFVESVRIEDEFGSNKDGVKAVCSRCGHEAESFGDGAASIRRCLVLLKEECPEGESNYYVEG